MNTYYSTERQCYSGCAQKPPRKPETRQLFASNPCKKAIIEMEYPLFNIYKVIKILKCK